MKELYHSRKKKIRGWKRHKRNIEVWKQTVMNLDMDYIRDNERDYAKLWIHPFYSLPKTNPPNWFNRLLFNAMIDVYLNWYEKMTDENEDFYLKIWLYEPNFIRSQLVVSYKDYIDFYKYTFDKNPVTKNFPIHKYKSLEDRLAMFNWELYIDADEHWECEMKEYMKLAEIEEIINKSYRTEKISSSYGDDVLYKVNVGDVWLGTLKKRITPN